ncbi:MAG: 50S ribosomal protein L21 [Cyanobacteria bacterium J069]|nr:MAG: 50S ribosomal protein L21 [Cyanobacteria bacterium J069]
MTYAIVETSGTQLRVEPGRFYDVNRLDVAEDEKVTLDRVLFVENDGEITVGQPLVEGATVEATVMRHLRARKIIVYKMQPKKKTRKKQGHRQDLTRLMIDAIHVGGAAPVDQHKASVKSAEPTDAAAEPAAAAADDAEA